MGEGAKGITWNKAIQAAWIANQGVKELEADEEGDELTMLRKAPTSARPQPSSPTTYTTTLAARVPRF